MRKLLTAALCLVLYFLPVNLKANHPPHVSNYINSYYELAIKEMHRSGIPASVTLAQGIHESSWGQGELSVNSNNHFGIKCKKTWTGDTFYIEDDDYRGGVLVKSCFRVYTSVEDSYVDHTNFLVQNSRYQTLFTYNTTDYTSWAKGLQTAGYATDEQYANKLIRTIEKYDLSKYDYVQEVQVPEVVAAPTYTIPSEVETFATVTANNTINEDDDEGDDEYEDEEYEADDTYKETSTVSHALPMRHYTLEASTAYDDEVPAAVSIEGYRRNARKEKSAEVVTEKSVVAPIIIEKKEKKKQAVNKPAKVYSAPVYAIKKQKTAPQKAKLDNRVSRDNNGKLNQLRAKPRLRSKLR